MGCCCDPVPPATATDLIGSAIIIALVVLACAIAALRRPQDDNTTGESGS